MYLLVDIGGSSVKSGVWQEEKLIETEQFPTPTTWQELLIALVALKKRKSLTYPFEKVGFSVPGIVDETTGRIDGASSVYYLHEVDFFAELTAALELPIVVANDANCASLAEVHFGAAKGVNSAIFVIIGTGIGGTIVNDGEILKGQHHFGGEFGMMLINGHDEWAKLGSAVHMARKVSKAKGFDEYHLSGKEVFKLAAQGDVIAQQSVEELYHYLALGIYNLQYIIDPELIVLGGGISSLPGLIPQIERHLEIIMSYGQRSPLFPNMSICHFGNEANLIGAAIHCERKRNN